VDGRQIRRIRFSCAAKGGAPSRIDVVVVEEVGVRSRFDVGRKGGTR
jgi:hypothetical protein